MGFTGFKGFIGLRDFWGSRVLRFRIVGFGV